ncbi:Lrp/AsnC family transcriptional regulator [Psychroserpens luteus]|uniref:Helix-turn-helix domain-containing protein n=1 Tax=Psychroserpens luteus TaxID=1434066 RepID=A0ABW5ZTR3_9FLAO|nr:Lrp/AsnC family transcriptional regulator [Psychroserpens luteus]
MIGYVLMHRDLMDWEWYQSPNVVRLYFHLIFKVNFKDKKWQGQLVKRGQLITSNSHLASDLRLSIQTVRTAIQKLQDSGYIKTKSTNRYTLITLVDYDKFQSAKIEVNKPVDTQTASNKQMSNSQLTITKESNKENKFNKEKIETRLKNFKKQVFANSNFKVNILNSFFNYWSELSLDKQKMKFESHKYFEIEKRLKKWASNERQFQSVSQSKKVLQTNR